MASREQEWLDHLEVAQDLTSYQDAYARNAAVASIKELVASGRHDNEVIAMLVVKCKQYRLETLEEATARINARNLKGAH